MSGRLAMLNGMRLQAVADLRATALRMRIEAAEQESAAGRELLGAAWTRFGAGWVDLAAEVIGGGR